MTFRPCATRALPLLLWLPLAAPPARAQTPEARVDAVFADVVGPTTPGCALSVMRDGAPIYEQGYGMANLEYGIPITPSSVFHVASVSKHFTAMAVELLVNEGKVSWDDDIRPYVPEVPDFGTTITLRHLVHHVSGSRDQWNLLEMAGWRWESDVVTQHDVLDITSRQTALNFPPGERYLYSNTGFTLLGVVVERVTGKTLRAFTTERIFEPLGMSSTHFHDDHEMIVPNWAWAYAPDPDGLYGLQNSIPDFDVAGATSLFTTVHDLAAWDRNFITHQIGGDAAFERLQRRFVLNSGDTIPYAHGIGHGRYRGLRTIEHGGADAGYRSNFVRFPDQGMSIAVLCNFPSANPEGRSQRVAEAYLEEDMAPRAAEVASPPAPVSVPRAELERVAGAYAGPERGVIRGTLRPLGQDRFSARRGSPTLTHLADGRLMVQSDTLRPVESWSPTERDLDAFVGTYSSADLGTEYTLVRDGGALAVHHRKLPEMRLEPLGEDEFSANGKVFSFTRDAGGRPAVFTASDRLVWNVRFER